MVVYNFSEIKSNFFSYKFWNLYVSFLKTGGINSHSLKCYFSTQRTAVYNFIEIESNLLTMFWDYMTGDW